MTNTPTAIRADIQIKAAVPTFLVPDVAGTARWYSEHLGFRTAGTFPKQEPYVYASLQRDGAEIMLLSLAGYEKPDLSARRRSEEHTSELQSRGHLVCRHLLEKKKIY